MIGAFLVLAHYDESTPQCIKSERLLCSDIGSVVEFRTIYPNTSAVINDLSDIVVTALEGERDMQIVIAYENNFRDEHLDQSFRCLLYTSRCV